MKANERSFETIWQAALDLAKSCKVSAVGNMQPRWRKQLPPSLQDSVVMEHLPSQQQAVMGKEDIRIHVFLPILDSMIAEMDRRFSVENCSMMKGLKSLNPTSTDFLCLEKVQLFGTFFDADIKDLNHEVPQAKGLLDRKFTKLGKEVPQSLLEFTTFIEPYRDVFSELFRLCKIGVTIPVSSASCELSFSTMKLIKTYLHNSMSNKRLSDLWVLHIERESSDASVICAKMLKNRPP